MKKSNFNAQKSCILRMLSCCTIDADVANELLAAVEHAEEIKN